MTHEEMFDTLSTNYPNLITSQTCLEIDVGWVTLLGSYCEIIEKLVECGVCEYTPISCIKEKFGTMRIHHSVDSDNIGYKICESLQSYTEHMSAYTCEKCGKNGKVVSVRGWWKCLCEECEKGMGE